MDRFDVIVQMLIGMQTAQAQIFNALIDAGALTREQAIASLQASIDHMPTEFSKGPAAVTIRQLISALSDPHPRSPESLRQMLRVVDGGSAPSGDTTPTKEP